MHLPLYLTLYSSPHFQKYFIAEKARLPAESNFKTDFFGLAVSTVCPGSLVNLYKLSHFTETDQISLVYSMLCFYRMSRKSCQSLYIESLYRGRLDFFGIQYELFLVWHLQIDCNSELGAQVKSDICNFIYLRNLLKSTAVTHNFEKSEKRQKR